MAFQQGLSGLYAASKALDVTSNNVANSATVGFKSGQAHFADVFAASLGGGGSSSVGIGTSVAAIQQQFTQGNITTTNNPLDISISGGGFYRMSNNGSITYSRAGQFHLDKDGYVVDDKARQLTGYGTINGEIVQAAPAPLQLSSANIAPLSTGQGNLKGVNASLNLDSREAVKKDAFIFTPAPNNIGGTIPVQSYNFSTSTSIFDSLGNAHTLTMYARKETTTTLTAATTDAAAATAAAATATAAAATANTAAAGLLRNTPTEISISDAAIAAALAKTTAAATATATAAAATSAAATATAAAALAPAGSKWLIFTSVDGTNPSNVAGNPTAISFNNSGKLLNAPGGSPIQINLEQVMKQQNSPITGAPMENIANTPLEFKLNFDSSTQFGVTSGTNSMQQDGYTSGRLTGVSVGAEGIVRGNYSNGQAKDLGQVVLANFTNPNGLASLGGNQWAETSASGPALVGAPNSGTLGVLQSTAVEESNVDLTAELVNMITQQRNYQANAQSIKTQDQILQTLVNLR